MNREVILRFKDNTFCDIGIDLTTSELGSGPVKNHNAATRTKPGWPFSFPRVRRAAFTPPCFGGSEIAGVTQDEVKTHRPVNVVNSSKYFLKSFKGGLGGFARFQDVSKRAVQVQYKYSGEKMKTITLTRELVESLKTEKGGFTGRTLRALGLKPYPPKGWKERLIGQIFATEQYQEALAGRYIIKGKKVRDFYRSPQVELPLLVDQSKCTRCRVNEAFWSATWCSECLDEVYEQPTHN